MYLGIITNNNLLTFLLNTHTILNGSTIKIYIMRFMHIVCFMILFNIVHDGDMTL